MFLTDGYYLYVSVAECPFDGVVDAPPMPTLLLVDPNMPIVNGLEPLRQPKVSANYRHLPVVILTTSSAGQDIRESYNLEAASFVTKPIAFSKLVDSMNALQLYWLDTVQLPRQF